MIDNLYVRALTVANYANNDATESCHNSSVQPQKKIVCTKSICWGMFVSRSFGIGGGITELLNQYGD